jgi:3-dehydroquinate dehydratase type I
MSSSKKYDNICGVVAAKTVDEALTIMERYYFLRFIEIRVDYFDNPIEALRGLSGQHINLTTKYILTYRYPEHENSWDYVEQVYTKIIKLKPPMVDFDFSIVKLNPVFLDLCKKFQIIPILSTHLKNTPEVKQLVQINNEIKNLAPDSINKIVTTAHCLEDNFTTLNFLKSSSKHDLISFSLNLIGRLSRILCTFYGSLLTYVTLSNIRVGPGILTLEEHEKVVSMLCLN